MPQSKDPRLCWEDGFFCEEPIWCTEPDIAKIEAVVTPYLHARGLGDPTVNFFTQGAWNKLYTITTADSDNGFEQELIFRVSLPVHPYYKTESEVATCDYIRLHTTIPAPRIFAWDSSSENELGFEWMLMEKLPGTPLAEVWDSLALERKVHVTQCIAQWTDALSKCRFNHIGSLYYSTKGNLGGFEVGRAVALEFHRGRCLQYNIHRGPFDTAEEFYGGVLATCKADVDFYAETADGQAILAKAEQNEEDPYEERHTHEDGRTYDAGDMHGIPKACDALSKILPRVFPREPVSSPYTFLCHPDLSRNNILVDDLGNPVGLVDWENAMTVPHMLVEPYPLALHSAEETFSELTNGISGLAPDDEDLRKRYHEWLEMTQLRKVFRNRLEELRSPWLKTFTERTTLMKEFIGESAGLLLTHGRIRRWVEELDGREDLDLPADKESRQTYSPKMISKSDVLLGQRVPSPVCI